MIVALSGCDYVNDVDNKPMSAKINGVLYKSEGFAYAKLAPCEIYMHLNGFSFRMRRVMWNADDAISLHICFTTYDSTKPEVGVVYQMNSQEFNPILYDSGRDSEILCDEYESRWITFSKIEELNEYTYILEGNFEVIFNGYGDNGEQCVITEGSFGPLSCTKHQ
jgi:hypothetical protein